MKKILLIGNSPLPEENTSSRPAAGLRTHQFLEILRKNHIVQLVTIAMPECYEKAVKPMKKRHDEGFSEARISKDDPGLPKFVQEVCDDFEPDVIVSVNTFPSFVASRLTFDAPLWCDLNGWVMAEGQAQAYKKNSNDYLGHYMAMEKSILQRADKISTVSRRQADAILGELAAFGRLNKASFGYDFVAHIPNGTEHFDSDKAEKELAIDVPESAVVAAWIGGYNTWVDEETLFEGLEAAMRKNDKLYFVSTGGSVKGLDKGTFGRFKEMISESEYKARFVFLGWVETDQMAKIYGRADFGLNVDRMCTETQTGARNRVNEMMKFGLPVVTTRGSEIADEVSRVGAGIAVESGNSEALAGAILKICETDLSKMGENGKRYIKEECNYKKVMRPLTEWLKNPSKSPDADDKSRFRRAGKLKTFWKYLRENGLKKTFVKILQRIR